MKRSIALRLLAAGMSLLLLAGCTGRTEKEPAPGPDPAPETQQPAVNEPAAEPEEPALPADVPADGPLTEEELRYFNEDFFNGPYMNLRNQFLSSLYETPEDINLYDLFYCGTGWDEAMPEEERAAFDAVAGFMDTDVTKVSAANADAALNEHMGLTLAETNQVGLDGFIYLPDYSAYYLAHGDTNYRMEVKITSGERRDGLLRLYYDDTFMADGQKCVTLRETGDGGYHFVSNSYVSNQ